MRSFDPAVAAVHRIAAGDGFTARGSLMFFSSQEDLLDFSHLVAPCLDAVAAGGTGEWLAPSPWHAALWLRDMAAGAAEGKPIRPQPEGRGGSVVCGSAPLFRGQRDADWEIAPSMFRAAHRIGRSGGTFDADAHGTAMMRMLEDLDRFRCALAGLDARHTDLALTDDVYYAAAQHYGMPTHLLDLTVDPFVAVWFACDGAEAGDRAAVWFIEYDRATDLGASVILAPPWVRRIYRQRGLFLNHLSAVQRNRLPLPWSRVVFPVDPSYLAALELLTGAMYPEDPWFGAAAAWASGDGKPAPDDTRETADELTDALVRSVGTPPFLGDGIVPARLAAWPDLLCEFLDWLAVRKESDRILFRCEVARQLAEDNPDLFNAVRVVLRFLPRMGIKPGDTRLGEYFGVLSECFEQQPS